MQSILPPLEFNSEVTTQYKLFLESMYLIYKSIGRGTSIFLRVKQVRGGAIYLTILSNFGSYLII